MYSVAVIDDNKDTLFASQIVLQENGFELKTFYNPDLFFAGLKEGLFDAVLLDMNFSKNKTDGEEGFYWLKKIKEADPFLSVVMCTAFGDINIAVGCLHEGAQDFITKPWRNEKLVSSLRTAAELSRSKRECEVLESKWTGLGKHQSDKMPEFIGTSPVMKRIFDLIRKIAVTDASVLITGENGTGKELVARAIHKLSKRKKELFLGVDMGAIPDNLFESEMFGYAKGAFTDASKDKAGKMELASKGTLFLDEIANISILHQPKMLRCLEVNEISRVGSVQIIPIDVRIISATNRNLKSMVHDSLFREDLYYRLKIIEIEIPPLRERLEDIKPLFDFYLNMFCSKYNRSYGKVDPDILKELHEYKWPGNVRELKHVVERAVILCESEILKAKFFAFRCDVESSAEPADENEKIKNLEERVSVFERNCIIAAIKNKDGNISEAARTLEISRGTMYRKMEKYGL